MPSPVVVWQPPPGPHMFSKARQAPDVSFARAARLIATCSSQTTFSPVPLGTPLPTMLALAALSSAGVASSPSSIMIAPMTSGWPISAHHHWDGLGLFVFHHSSPRWIFSSIAALR